MPVKEYPEPTPDIKSPCCGAPSTQQDKWIYTCDKCGQRFVLDT